jgi:hypothetical protein
MLDPLSLSSVVVGFVEFALKVVKATAEFVRDVKECPTEFKRLHIAAYEFGVHVRRLTPAINEVEERYRATKGIRPFAHFR